MTKLAQILHFFMVALLVQGCLQDPISVSDGAEMTVRVHVTGGFGGADFVVVLDGAKGRVVGESCGNLCDFSDGQILQSLTPDQVDYVWNLFQESNVHAFDGEDFGAECCDQFYWEVDYLDSVGRSLFRGTSSVFPQRLMAAVGTVVGMAFGTVPIVVNFDTNPGSWPGDPFQIQNAEVSGQTLRVELSYGGGCRTHDVKAVSWGGWMESSPVQIRLFLSHEDFDDPCDAWITRDFGFDLTPLKISYQTSYGVGEPGKTTLILLLADPQLASPQGARWLEYSF